MPDQPWYREWRRKERAEEAKIAADPAYARRAAVKRVIGEAVLLAVIVLFVRGSLLA